MQEFLDASIEIYQRGDSRLNEFFRPFTQRLNSKSNFLKYFPGYGTTTYPIFFPIPTMSIGLCSMAQNCVNVYFTASNFLALIDGTIEPEELRKGYKEDDLGQRVILNEFNFKSNQLGKRLRFGSFIEGISLISYGTYSGFFEKDPNSIFFLSSGILALKDSAITYLIQADDDEMRKNKDLFPNTKRRLEDLLDLESYNPV